MKPLSLLISCEHAVNTVPDCYQHYFSGYEALLNTHRGIDFGALTTAMYLSESFNCDLIKASISRLVIDCNRSLHHPNCLSEISTLFSEAEQDQLIQRYYLPYRHAVEEHIHNKIIAGHCVLHLSIHSFTPIWEGMERNADIGFLYDPKRPLEKQFAIEWQKQLKAENAPLRVRRNYPYVGYSDGLTTSLRKLFSAQNYVGIEVESNQSLTRNEISLKTINLFLEQSLKELMNHASQPK